MSARRVRGLWCAAAALACAPWGLQAQSLYQHKLEASVGTEYDTNPGLAAPALGSVSRLRVAPRYTLLRRDGPAELRLKLGATLEQSSDEQLSRHRRDGDGQIEWQREFDTTMLVLRAAYQKASLRDVLLKETGQVSVDGSRTVRTLGATLLHQINPLYTATGGLEVNWNQFSSNARTPDSRLVAANGEISRALALGQTVFVAGHLSRFAPDAWPATGTTPPPAQHNSQLYSMDVGYRSQITDSPWQWQARVGVARYTGPFSDTTAQGDVSLGYQGERWSASLALAHRPVADTLRGAFSRNDQARAALEYQLTEFTRLGVDASVNRTRSTQTDRSTAFGLRLSSELSPLWRATLALRRTQVDRATSLLATQASGTSVNLFLTYSHPDF